MQPSLALALCAFTLLATQTAHAITRPLDPAEKECLITVDEQLKQRYGQDTHLQFSEAKTQANPLKVLGHGQLLVNNEQRGLLNFTCLINPDTGKVRRIIYKRLIKSPPAPSQ